MTQDISIGDLVCGERPNPLVYQYRDDAGNPLGSLTGYTAVFVFKERDGDPVTVTDNRVQITDPAASKATYFWNGTEFLAPGSYEAQMWVGNGIQRYASLYIRWTASTPVGGVVPNI